MASDTMSDDFSAFDLGEFSQGDFAEIDLQIARHFPPPLKHPFAQRQQPHEREDTMFGADEDSSLRANSVGRMNAVNKTEKWDPKTRIQVLSVSNVVSPRWCEQRFVYGFLRRRSESPTSFFSGKGKRIKVDMKIAEENAAQRKRGMDVHLYLEREISEKKYSIRPRFWEERWALRILGIFAALRSLIDNCLTREMPVFGFINDVLIVGIIDEVAKVELPVVFIAAQTPSASEQDIEDHPSPQKTNSRTKVGAKCDLGWFLKGTPDTQGSKNIELNAQYTLHIAEIKTRATETTPADSDSVGSCDQLMLYRGLLNNLLFSPERFDFPGLWARIKVDSTAPFSTEFLKQAGILAHNEGFKRTNLDTLVESWELAVERLKRSGVRSVDEKLSLVYRHQHGILDARTSAGKAPQDERRMDIDTYLGNDVHPRSRLHAPRPHESRRLPPGAKTTLNAEIKGNSRASGTALSPQNALPLPPRLDDGTYKVISHKEIIYDEGMVQENLESTLELLRGEREPLGVPVELAWRCNTCEYRDDCEWREEMAGLAVGRKKSV
ncbi:exonuclease V [Ephemerocybe angulata]|uniref:Exonuclease V n=1 Tax=Ephemerocybe angulata TaxID=980116 RepID=A0A8H6MAK4_9AGAR|nr:exonuclease V [Tulosesus angulatus]